MIIYCLLFIFFLFIIIINIYKNINEQLYYPDINIDINLPNKCHQLKESIIADEVIIDNIPYYYINDNNILKIYKKNENNDNYFEITDTYIIDIIKKHI